MKKTKKIHYAWIILLAVSLIRGVAGPAINASSGVFLSPVSSDLGIGIGKLSLYLSVSSAATLLWLPIAGSLFNKYGVKSMVFAGALLQTVPFILLGFMNNVWAWYILSVPLAMGAVLLANLLGPVLINRWFVKNLGLVMGLMMTITGMLGAVFQPTLMNLIAERGWRFTYTSFGIFALIFILAIGLFFLKNEPGDKGIRPYGQIEESIPDSSGVTSEIKSIEGMTTKEAVKTFAFYALLLFMIVLTGFAVFQQHVATCGLGLGFSMNSIGKVLSLSMIGSAVGSILIGVFSDRLGIVPTSIVVLGMGILATILFLFGGETFFMFALATFLHGLATSSIGVVAPLLTARFFGFRDYAKLLSWVMIGSPIASIILMPVYGFIYDTFGSYRFVFLFLLVALVVAGVGLVLGERSRRKMGA